MTTLTLCLVDAVSLKERSDNTLTLHVRERGELTLKACCTGVMDSLADLFQGGRDENYYAETLASERGLTSVTEFLRLLDGLKNEMLVGYEWRTRSVVHGFLEPLVPQFRPIYQTEDVSSQKLRLSRFCFIRRTDNFAVLEIPGGQCRVSLRTRSAWQWLAGLSEPCLVSDVELLPFKSLLASLGFLEGHNAEESEALASWEFHDRLFHASSRLTSGPRPIGATYRFKGRFPAPRALKGPSSSFRIPLDRQSSLLQSSNVAPFDAVLDRRRCIREMDDERPITLEELAETLHRTARIKDIIREGDMEVLHRPFPSGGGIHELEFYIAVRLCAGLEAGLYHYRGDEHCLYLLPSCLETGLLLRDAAADVRHPEIQPQCVIILASRLPRLAWKYQGIAYRLTLLNAGAAIQTLCLVATALDLACYPLGSGNSDLFAIATGLDQNEETSVGEVALGSSL
jgi:SagB-type dehydrogenase family enzyme